MSLFRLLPIISAAACLTAGVLSAKPTLWLIGDSTVCNSTPGQRGWGEALPNEFDPAKIRIVNRAIGGRSSRSFLTQGRWEAIMTELQAGDYVLMQFGHNDGGEMFTGTRPRATIKGNGEESKDGIVEATGVAETVHSYGWYLRTYANQAKQKGATPIIMSQIPRNIWKDGAISRNDKDYALWARQAAAQVDALFLDFNGNLADTYENIGRAETATLFAGTDHTHTNAEGAAFNAAVLARSIRALPNCELGRTLLPPDLWLPSVFSDHLVLQRDVVLPVWGRSLPGAKVTATLGEHTLTARANPKGHWRLEFPPLPAGGPHTLKVSSGEAVKTCHDLLVGEVWLCSGQSNMDFTLAPTEKRYFAGTRNWEAEVARANHPRIRMFTPEWTLRNSPGIEVEGRWNVCTPENARNFSAAAYFFGRELQEELQVPIGLITCAFGASTAEAWISREALLKHPQLKPLLEAYGKKRITYRDTPSLARNHGEALTRWREESARRNAEGKKAGRKPRDPDPVQDQHNPTVLYNGMIAPLVGYSIRGFLWYQGESNVGTHAIYPQLQDTLIRNWRSRWGNETLPFYFVQLAAYKAPAEQPSASSFASMREAQATSLTVEHTGMAVTIDIGEEKDIHPRNKQDVGHRLARLALARTYGKDVAASGPTFREQSVEGNRIRLHFDHLAEGLVAKGGPLKHFAIAGRDGQFVWADATIDDSTVLVSSPSVTTPAFVRYAWADNPAGANLYNSAGLPAAPFRTDP